MSFKTFCYFLAIFVSACVFASCKGPIPDDHEGTTEGPEADFYISSNDSGLTLSFSNFNIANTDSFTIQVNKQPAAFRMLPDKLMFIPHDSVPPGRNIINFAYRKNGVNDTLNKVYFHVLNISYKVVNTYPHNRNYFTQGLLFTENGDLVESTGLTGQSRILFYRKTGAKTFKPVDSIVNQGQEFGEGIAIVGHQLVQLLWQNGYIRIYDKSTRKHLRNLEYAREGWGICNDGNIIYTSDGSGYIHQIDISGDKVNILKSIQISDENGLIQHINELEFANGLIFANIWQTAMVYVIDPRAGLVIGKIDLSSLAMKEMQMNNTIDVLNGIAYNPSKNTYLLTGKNWGFFYEIQLEENLVTPQ